MKNKIKIIYLIALILIIMLFSSSFAGQDDSVLTLENCIETALNNSRGAVLDQLDIQMKEKALQNVLQDAQKLGDAYGIKAVLNNKLMKYVEPVKAEAEIEISKRTALDNEKKLRIDVEKAFYSFLLTQKQLIKEKALLDIAVEEYTIYEAEYIKNLITRNDLENAKYSLDSQKLQVEVCEGKLSSKDMTLKSLMGLSLGGERLNVQGLIEYREYESIDLDTYIELCTKTDTDIYIKQEAVRAQELTFGYITLYYKKGEETYDKGEFDLIMSRKDLDEAYVNLEVNIRNSHNNLLTSQEKAELAIMKETLKKEGVRLSQTKYENGLINRRELLSSQKSLIEAEYEKYNAFYEFNINRIDFLIE